MIYAKWVITIFCAFTLVMGDKLWLSHKKAVINSVYTLLREEQQACGSHKNKPKSMHCSADTISSDELIKIHKKLRLCVKTLHHTTRWGPRWITLLKEITSTILSFPNPLNPPCSEFLICKRFSFTLILTHSLSSPASLAPLLSPPPSLRWIV